MKMTRMTLAFAAAATAVGICALAMTSGLLSPVAAAQSTKSPQAVQAVTPSIDVFKLAIPRLLLAVSAPSGAADADGCLPLAGDESLEAYRSFLSQRLEKQVVVCSISDEAEGAAALAAGKVHMALMGPETYKAVQADTRAILAPRFDPTHARVLGTALTMKASSSSTLAQLSGKRPIFIGTAPPSRAILLQGLSDHGFAANSLASEVIVDETSAYQALKDGRGDVLIVTTGARQRICRAIDQNTGCSDITEVWQGRPTAPLAFVVHNDMPAADRYQLVGIHIAMHKQNPGAFALVANMFPGSSFLDPTEPGALIKGPR